MHLYLVQQTRRRFRLFLTCYYYFLIFLTSKHLITKDKNIILTDNQNEELNKIESTSRKYFIDYVDIIAY